jgi:hypothetical protein
MIIKYSQLDLAGNLFYPVGILIGASVLLAGTGIFLQLTREDRERQQSRLKLPIAKLVTKYPSRTDSKVS